MKNKTFGVNNKSSILKKYAIQASFLLNQLLAGVGRKNQQIIWVVGIARSGTTWLMDLLNYNNDYRVMFEPFNPINSSLEWLKRFQYVRPDECDGEFEVLANKVFGGSFQHERVDQFNRFALTKGIIIKDIYAHLFIKWVDVHFPEVKKVLLFRHPLAVAVSKDRLKGVSIWMSNPADLLSQPSLYRDFLHPFENSIYNARSYIEQQVAIWCIAYYVPLHQLKPDRIHLAFYENLYTEPDKELKELFGYLGIRKSNSEIGRIIKNQLKTPSVTCRKDSAIVTSSDVLFSWHNQVNPEDIGQADQILRNFGLHNIYQANYPMPNREVAEAILYMNQRDGLA